MLREKPNLSEDRLLACLRTHYGFNLVSVRYLPIGHDMRAFVYEALTAEGDAYFVKVRDGAVALPSLIVPRLLIDSGIPHILAPLRTGTQELWCPLDRYCVVVYPFIRGENAMIAGLSESQWREFGATLAAIHSSGFADLLRGQVSAETFAIPSAALVRQITADIQEGRFASPTATDLATFWKENLPWIDHLLARAESLGRQLQSRTFEHVLCHADIHAANLLVGDDGSLYLIDWDGPLLAPRERDLLFVVGAIIARRVQPWEEAWFFEGYGSVKVDGTALAYYRYERVIEDLGEMAKFVFWDMDASEEARAAEAALLLSQFAPDGMVASAMDADKRQGGPSPFESLIYKPET